MGERRPAYIALLVAILCWSSLAVVSKPIVPIVGAPLVALDRTVIASLVLTSLCLYRDRGAWRLLAELRERPWQLFLLGLCSFFGSSLLLLLSLKFLSASIATILNNMGPLWLALGTAAMGKSRRPALLLVGSLLAFSGVMLVLLTHGNGTGAGAGLDWRGVVLALSSSFIIAAQAIVGRRMMPGHDALAVTAVSAALTVPPLFAVVLPTTGLAPLVVAPITVKLLLLYLGLFATSVNFACFNFALTRIPATQASNLMYLVPPIGVTMAVVLLHEPAGWGLVLGLAATILGILLAHTGASSVALRRPPRPVVVGAERVP